MIPETPNLMWNVRHALWRYNTLKILDLQCVQARARQSIDSPPFSACHSHSDVLRISPWTRKLGGEHDRVYLRPVKSLKGQHRVLSGVRQSD
jgi:hypothetical protein